MMGIVLVIVSALFVVLYVVLSEVTTYSDVKKATVIYAVYFTFLIAFVAYNLIQMEIGVL